MTRINVGINPAHLCDQHLLAEYRELPRLFSKTFKHPAPARFCLGPGHVRWCAQFPGSLANRWLLLVDECQHRGFNIQFISIEAGLETDAFSYWHPDDIEYARPLVIARIQTSLQRMRNRRSLAHRPRWTVRFPPAWAYVNPRSEKGTAS